MRIVHNKKNASCYIQLIPEPTTVYRSYMISTLVVVDMDEERNVIGLKILEHTDDAPEIIEV